MRVLGHSFTSSKGRGLFFYAMIFFVVVTGFTPMAMANGGDGSLWVGGDFNTDGELRIGSDLDVAILQGSPLTSYRVMLIDESNEIVVSSDLMTGLNGTAHRQNLWIRTGVVGCDPGAEHDPSIYQYQSFGEAEDLLEDRTFELKLVKVDGDSGSEALDAVSIPLVVEHLPIEAHPSDEAGCLRTQFHEEAVSLAIQHQQPVSESLKVFVVEAQSVWLPGDLLIDVRDSGSQQISVPSGHDHSVFQLWPSPSDGEFQILLQQDGGTAVPTFDPWITTVVETPIIFIGATLPDHCKDGICPPPDDAG